MLLSRVNRHERDAKIVFHEEGHIYDIEGLEEHPVSVTTLIHNFFPKFNADLVIDKMMKGRNWKTSKYYGKTKEQIKDEWEASGTEASTLGTAMHADIERFLNEEDPLNPNSVEFGYFKQFWSYFTSVYPGYKPYRTEWLVYDEDKGLAGSVDCVLQNDSGDVIILDWKRSKEIKKSNSYEKGFDPFGNFDNCNYWHYTLQLNIYRHLLMNKYNKNVVSLHIVVLHPNNTTFEMHTLHQIDLTPIWNILFDLNKHYCSNHITH